MRNDVTQNFLLKIKNQDGDIDLKKCVESFKIKELDNEICVL